MSIKNFVWLQAVATPDPGYTFDSMSFYVFHSSGSNCFIGEAVEAKIRAGSYTGADMSTMFSNGTVKVICRAIFHDNGASSKYVYHDTVPVSLSVTQSILISSGATGPFNKGTLSANSFAGERTFSFDSSYVTDPGQLGDVWMTAR